MAKFAPLKIALWGWARRRIECASAATTATAIAVPVSRRKTLASMPIADTLTLPRPYTRTEKSWRTSVSASSVATRPGSCETVATTVRAMATSTAEATIAEVTTSVVTPSSREEPSADEASIGASPGRAGRSSGRGRRICTRSSGPGGGDLRLSVVAKRAWAPPLSGGIAPIASDAQDPRPARAFLDPIDHLAADPVHGPHDHDHADVGPEAVDREVRRDPFRQGDHRDVDREVREPERDDDERERQQRQERLEHGVRDAEDCGADQERRPAVDADASPERVRGPERSGVDRPGDGEAHEPRHGASLGGRRQEWDHRPRMARLTRLALVVLALALAAPASAGPRDPKERHTKAGEAIASRAVLHLSDFELGWKRASHPGHMIRCRGYNPDLSGLTRTGRARSEFSFSHRAVVQSFVSVYLDAGQAVAAFKAAVR